MEDLPSGLGDRCCYHAIRLLLDGEVLVQSGVCSLCAMACLRRTVQSEGVFVQRAGGGRQMLDSAGKELKPFPGWLPVIAQGPTWLKQYRAVVSIDGSQSELVGVEKFVRSLDQEIENR